MEAVGAADVVMACPHTFASFAFLDDYVSLMTFRSQNSLKKAFQMFFSKKHDPNLL